MPGLAIEGTNVRKDSVNRIAMRYATVRRPEGEAVVEGVHCRVLKLNAPVRAAVFRLVDAKISGVVPDGHEISHTVAHALHIAELQAFGSRHDPGFPVRAAIGRNHVRASGSRCPDDSRVHWTHGNQQLRRAAVLWNESRLMTFPCVFCIAGGDGGGYQENEQQRTL